MKTTVFKSFALLAIVLGLSSRCSAAVIKIGFLKAEGSLNPEAEAEFNGAKDKYSLTVLVTDKASGKFKDEKGNGYELSDFALIWWHDNVSSAISPAFMEKKVLDTINKYINDGEAAGIVPTPEAKDHPIFKGKWEEEKGEAKEKITVNSGGYPVYSDFHGSGGPKSKDAILLGKGDASSHSDTGENPFVEYKYNQGSIIIMGWRLPHWSKKDNKFRNNLELLTANIIEYLASRSAFSAVETEGKLSVTWGALKRVSE